MEWIEANGASLRYELSGSGRDTLVMVHEVGVCIESWDDTLPAFQPHFRSCATTSGASGCRRRRAR